MRKRESKLNDIQNSRELNPGMLLNKHTTSLTGGNMWYFTVLPELSAIPLVQQEGT